MAVTSVGVTGVGVTGRGLTGMVVTGRAAAVGGLLAVLVGMLTAAGGPGVALVVGATALLLAAVAADVVLAAEPGKVAIRRTGDQRCRLGQDAMIDLHLTNTGRRRLRAMVRDAWVPTAGAAFTSTGRDRCRVDLPPKQTARLAMRVTPQRRGDRPADLVTIRAIGPLGLAGRQRSMRCAWSVRTLPPFTSSRHLPARLARLREMDGRSIIAIRAAGTEFDSLREYVPGDDVRSIDWRASARAADVMLRTWRPERDRRVVIVLDTGRTCAARIGDGTRLDVLMDAALLLAALAGRAGDRVDVMAHDRRTHLHVRGATGNALLPSLVDSLATVEPLLVETDHRGLVGSVLSRIGKRALVVVLTSVDRPAMEEGLLPVLPTLCARHQVIVAAVTDPSTPEPALTDRRNVTSTYGRAARAREELDQIHVTAALHRLGATVALADPDRLAPVLADTYLDLKASGRL